MTLTERDRKILIGLVPILVAAAYWFLLLAPKREEASAAAEELAKQEQRRDAAQALLSQANAARTSFAADYGEIVRLGKAIPAKVDMPSLLVQLDMAARGTGIRFTRIAAGERQGGAPAVPAPAPQGAEPAQSEPGSAAQAAEGAAEASGSRNAAAEQSGVDPADTQTSTSTGDGLPVGGGAATGAAAGAAGGAPVGLEAVPLQLELVGNFFRLADFFHAVKRFVRVAEGDVVVGGRLLTIDSVKYSSEPSLFPRLKAELTATIYLSPRAQGATAGATPEGPAPATPAAGAPAPEGGSPAPASTPTATSTP